MNKAAFLIAVVAAAQPSPPEPVFRAGTRLVEVEVIVRNQRVRPPGLRASLAYFLDSGPPFGPPGSLAKASPRTISRYSTKASGSPSPSLA